MNATGTFEVTMNPLSSYSTGIEGNKMGRMSIDKSFYGPLQATSEGEMLTALTAVKGSAGYVALEQVAGNLDGKKGTFILQHFGQMVGPRNELILKVVPNSGTGQLTGLSGEMTISITDGLHHYSLEYSL